MVLVGIYLLTVWFVFFHYSAVATCPFGISEFTLLLAVLTITYLLAYVNMFIASVISMFILISSYNRLVCYFNKSIQTKISERSIVFISEQDIVEYVSSDEDDKITPVTDLS